MRGNRKKIFHPSNSFDINSKTLYEGTSPPDDAGAEAVKKIYNAEISNTAGIKQYINFPRTAKKVFFINHHP